MSEEYRMVYTDNPEFNEWLDNDGENSVTIAGYTFSPSETLYQMNYDQYVKAYTAYLEDDAILLDDIYSNFPVTYETSCVILILLIPSFSAVRPVSQ